MKSIYLAHPVAGNPLYNAERAKRWIRYIYENTQDVVLVAPWIIEVELYPADDDDPVLRKEALRRCCAVARRCDELWAVGDRISMGMLEEIHAARRHGLPVMMLITKDGEPPKEWSSPSPHR